MIKPEHQNYDVIIVGGAIMGASAAWFLSDDEDFDGRVLVACWLPVGRLMFA